MQKKEIVSMMEETRVFHPSDEVKKKAYIKSLDEYKALQKKSIDDPDGFWGEQASNLDWYKKWDKVLEWDFNKPEIKWFMGGKLNVSYNCLDRHLATKGNKAALIWQGEPLEESKVYTYQQLHYHVNKFANVLKKHGVKRGDRVSVYLPMIPELPITMLACARIGAIHSVVFGGFSAEALRDRINDCGSEVVVTCDGYYRSGKTVGSKENADKAIKECPGVKKVIVVKRMGTMNIPFTAGRDFWWHEEMAKEDIKPFCEHEKMDAEDLLFILYTSGNTGKPKGVMHTTAGYLLFTELTLKWVFDVKDEDVWFCTADIGWVSGHSNIVYGPLALGATSLMFEGVPTYPNPDRFWEIVERFKINQFYTAPTAIRALMRDGEKWTQTRDLSSLRVLGSVGEPINPEAWMWYFRNIGKEKLPIMDTWWQTETGGFLITPVPTVPLKPGSATFPFPGVVPKVLRENASECEADEGGSLVIQRPWPGMLRGFWNDPDRKRFKETYFSLFPGVYFTGDGARRDPDGYYWLMGRIDDVINVSGHRIGTAEVESALVSHAAVAEAAVIGYPHEIKGTGIYTYVTLIDGVEPSDELKKELVVHVRKVLGPIATPDKMQFAPGLPKTRSGKIMRRILRKIAEGRIEELGDTSTLADPSVVTQLVAERL